jgi:phage terminase small subunit
MSKELAESKLTAREERFLIEYLKDFNGTKAAIAAGYSEISAHVLAHRLLSKANIKLRVKQYMDSVRVTPQRILNELAKIAFGDMKDLAEWNQSGVSFKPSSEVTDDAAATISEISETFTEAGSSLKIKRYDKTKALELLGRYQKLFQEDKTDVTLNVGIKVVVEDYGAKTNGDPNCITAEAKVVSESD